MEASNGRGGRPASFSAGCWRLAVVLGATSAVWLNMGACGSSNDGRPFQDAGSEPSNEFGGTSGTGSGGSGGRGGSGAEGGAGGRGGLGGSGATGPSDSSGGSAGNGDSAACPTGCEDGLTCTIDVCRNGTCLHLVDPAVCPAGTFCHLTEGCASFPACSTAQQCIDLWRDDACKSQVICDRVTATCRFNVLDGDGDGHPPPVCGGDDCDDSRGTRFPGNSEACDLVDNDCDGIVDEQATCPQGLVCRAGGCACPPDQRVCGTQCVTTESDVRNCGACGNVCQGNRVCNRGRCCTPDGTSCIDAGTTTACNPAFCPNTGVGTPCCLSGENRCGMDTGMGCMDVRDG